MRRIARTVAPPVLLVGALLAVGLAPGAVRDSGRAEAAVANTTTRTYYIAADEVNWNYAPLGRNEIAGRPFNDDENVFVGQGPDRIGSTYRKALFRQYTDATFSRLQPKDARWEHTGLLGPTIRAEVGDTIKVVFRNNASRPYSMHPHGVRYAKDSEGAPYNDGTAGADKADDAVPPGQTVTYTWEVPVRSGPAEHDGQSVMWMYHSHTDEIKDTNSGLMGPMIVYPDGALRADGSVAGIDREFVAVFSVLDENQSHYLHDNIDRFAGNPGSVDPADEGFEESNLMHSINGYVFGNGPVMTANRGERVRWYLMSMGTEVDLHTPHFHGNTVTTMGMRTDVLELLPASMKMADMVPDAPGTWLLHCHVNDHIAAGMSTRYRIR
jgi:FtsP/CotA-like multicopper oxidase with cupredoxin domain